MMQYELAIACIPKVASFNRVIARHFVYHTDDERRSQ